MKRSVNILIIIIVAGAFAFLITGCDNRMKYKVLTFFFTGVPPLEGEEQSDAGLAQEIIKPKKKKPPYPVFVHGPRAAGECFFCHTTDTTQSFKKLKQARTMPSLSQTRPGKLATSRRELCIQCHTSKSPEMIYLDKKWVHGPVAQGYCMACHDYHATKYRYMLYTESTVDLCTRCHKEGFLLETEEHKNGKECVSCHNPHIGANRLMLKKDYDEIF